MCVFVCGTNRNPPLKGLPPEKEWMKRVRGGKKRKKERESKSLGGDTVRGTQTAVL